MACGVPTCHQRRVVAAASDACPGRLHQSQVRACLDTTHLGHCLPSYFMFCAGKPSSLVYLRPVHIRSGCIA